MKQVAYWLMQYPDEKRQVFVEALRRGIEAAQSAGNAVNASSRDQEIAVGSVLDEAITQLTQARQCLKQMMVENQVMTNTHKLRAYDDPYWARLRQLLHERGFDASHAAYVNGFPVDASLETGVVVIYDPERVLPVRTFYFELAWHYPTAIDSAVVTVWHEISNSSEEQVWPEHLAFAKALVLGENQ
jgi:hypothetical protein